MNKDKIKGEVDKKGNKKRKKRIAVRRRRKRVLCSWSAIQKCGQKGPLCDAQLFL
jgi:hypothetical protein